MMKKKLKNYLVKLIYCINLVGILYEKKKEILLKIFIQFSQLFSKTL